MHIETSPTHPKNVVSLPGQGRSIEVLGTTQTWKVDAEHTDGDMVCVEIDVPAGSGVPLHVHAHEDETFYVLQGRIRFAGDDIEGGSVIVASGGAVHGPRGRRHGFACEGSAPAKMLVIVRPGRPTEDLFTEIAQAGLRQGFAPPAEQVAEACGRYGISFG